MRIYSIDLTNGKRELVWLYKREVTLDLIEAGKKIVQHHRRYPLHLRFDGHNLTVTDHGLSKPVMLADTALTLGQPRIWLPHQELRIGDGFLLSWTPSSESAGSKTAPTVNTQRGWQRGRNQWGVFNGFLGNWQRSFGFNLERIVPLLLAFLFTSLLVFLVVFLIGKISGIRTTIAQVIPPTLIPSATATAARTPVPKQKADFPNTPSAPTVVRVENLVDLPPTPTKVGALPLGVTATPIPCVAQTLGRGEWNEALDALNVTYQPACVRPGKQFWRLIEAKWLDADASNGYHHVFVDLLDENSQRVMQPPTQFVMQWATGTCNRYMQSASDPLGYGAHCPMYAAGAAYRVFVAGLPSDMIEGIGLGSIDQREWRILTSYQFKFQRTTFQPEP